MTRPIKFRAWDNHNKRFITLDELQSFGAIHVENDGVFSLSPDFRFLSNMMLQKDTFDFQQFTGLLDKNGKEIYEGDIVKCQQGCNHQVIYVHDIGGEFGGGMPGFVLEGLLKNGGKGYAWTGEEEVIGNIYENPDLLTNN